MNFSLLFNFILFLTTRTIIGEELNTDEQQLKENSDIENTSIKDENFLNDSLPNTLDVFKGDEQNHSIDNSESAELYRNVSTLKLQPANVTKKYVACRRLLHGLTVNDEVYADEPTVELINGTRLTKLLTPDPEVSSKESEGDCVVVLFFACTCPFCSQAAPHFNALARAYPDVKMVALDALKYHGINAQYGIVGVPTLKLFHNGRPVAKFNGTEYTIHTFSRFINKYTGLMQDKLVVMSKDFHGPVASVIKKEIDYFLVMSWVFIIICGVYFFGKSAWWKTIVETVQNNWRESEAQHEHVD